MHCIVTYFAMLPDSLHVRPVASPRDGIIGRLEVEADEMGSFVKKKANKQGVWIAMDTQTRQIMALHASITSPFAIEKLRKLHFREAL